MQQLIHSHPHQLALFSDTEVSRSYTENLLAIAQPYSDVLARRQKVTMHQVRSWMNREFGGSDAEGKWTWKDAYEAQEAALVLLLRRSKAMLAPDPFQVLSYLGLIENNLLTQTKRDEESQKLQQFSTPLLLAYLTFLCAGSLQAQDLVLEPSAGTGMLAIWADRSGAKLVLNELSDRRVGLLRKLFPQSSVYQYNGEQIHDRLPQEHRPSIVLMNPPFSASPHVAKRYPLATVNHIRSAFARLLPGGRLVVISADWFAPPHPLWQALFKRLPQADPKLTVVVDGNAYYKHGTTIGTRITVIDKCIQNVEIRSPLLELPLTLQTEVLNDQGQRRQLRQFLPQQVKAILQVMPPRLEVQLLRSPGTVTPAPPSVPRTKAAPESTPKSVQPAVSATFTDVVEVHFQVLEQTTTLTQEAEQESIYQNYQPQRIRVVGAQPHPTQLCESVALASVQPPIPQYHPCLPQQLITDGILSEAQLESIIYAGDAHAHYLRGSYKVEERGDTVSICSPNERASVQFRQGWFLGDGTGAGKGRQLAGIILDNLLQGRTKALWISKNDKLLEDARRDWCAVGGQSTDIFALSQFKQGADIPRSSGILFLTYATLRTGEKPNKPSRLQQILNWLGSDFAGVIVFDEAHEMGNAIAETGARGVRNASQQGLMGVRLQNLLPHARVVYASATGASKVSHLAYATRLGLWQTGDFPFTDRSDFIRAIEQGGVAAMEVVCRDLKSLSLYVARNLSFAGVQYEALEVHLSPEQIALYDRYASAFQIIHTSLDAALLICNITSSTGKSLNKQAKSSALSSFESHKQRFFNHLLTAMKCPTLIRSIEQDLAGDRAVVIQIVSTNEALLERRLAQIPTEEWNDLSIDITPREYVMDYLVHAFPIRLYQVCTDENGNEYSEPVSDAQGNAVYSQTAIEQRQELIESLVSLPPLPGALDQLLYHFGEDRLAEVTGRSLRLLQDPGEGRLYVNRRSATANLSETDAFMQGHKSILVFSDAGGTGRSYHADLNQPNQKRRVHYLLEAGWRADTAIQGLGRSHRTNQASAPIFRPVVTTVRGERRFISTIARRLDALGALTRGQRQTGGQNLFDPRDNLESADANAALLEFFHLLYREQIDGCRLAQFQAATGLNLLTEEGQLREELPSISKFLNRLLALPIHLQNSLFEVFEQLLIVGSQN